MRPSPALLPSPPRPWSPRQRLRRIVAAVRGGIADSEGPTRKSRRSDSKGRAVPDGSGPAARARAAAPRGPPEPRLGRPASAGPGPAARPAPMPRTETAWPQQAAAGGVPSAARNPGAVSESERIPDTRPPCGPPRQGLFGADAQSGLGSATGRPDRGPIRGGRLAKARGPTRSERGGDLGRARREGAARRGGRNVTPSRPRRHGSSRSLRRDARRRVRFGGTAAGLRPQGLWREGRRPSESESDEATVRVG